MKKIIFVTVILTITASINTVSAQSTPEEMMSPFFEYFENDVDKAIDYLFSTNPLIAANKEAATEMKEKFETSRKMLGNYYGYEIAEKSFAGKSFAKYVYILKYDRQPVKMIIFMYCPDKKWKLQNINFQEDLSSELKPVE